MVLKKAKIQIGLESLVSDQPGYIKGKKLALLCNQASTDSSFTHGRDLINARFPGQLRCLFSPQHGFFSDRQDNMIESANSIDPVLGIPIYSLYGETRKPYPEWFADVDILLVDLVDVGTRVYTFIWTLVHCLQVAAQTGVKVVILDRPNPIGGKVEGNLVREELFSFVGLWPIPMRHGLTVGELALLCNSEMTIGADLEVITAAGWRRNMLFPDTGLPWLFPSPNMPSSTTALVYPGQVIWEGTNISEGRGTTLPFELVGAPFWDFQEISNKLQDYNLAGCLFRPLVFEPVAGKWAGDFCRGLHLHVTDEETFKPYFVSLALLQTVMFLYPEEFAYKEPPYEYEYEKLPLDMIIGNSSIRKSIADGADLFEIEASWQGELDDYKARIEPVLLYG